jgi:hypothetical protein
MAHLGAGAWPLGHALGFAQKPFEDAKLLIFMAQFDLPLIPAAE